LILRLRRFRRLGEYSKTQMFGKRLVNSNFTLSLVAGMQVMDRGRRGMADTSLRARGGWRLALALAMLALVLAAPVRGSAADAGALEERHMETVDERERLLQRIAVSEDRIAALSDEVAELRKDNATLTAALVQAAKTERKLSEDIAAIAGRLEELSREEGYLRESLAGRRGVLAEVLGALQRMGRDPPPAMLVRPDDALSSVRSAILLGAVVPELRAETEVLIADLNELARIMGSIEAERDRLEVAMTGQAEERERISLLADEKRRLQRRSEAQLVREQERAAELAQQAGSMEELIASLEAEIEAARLEEEARREAEEAELAEEADPSDLAIEAPARFAAIPFSALQGQIGLPVQGSLAARFGDDDEAGGRLAGDIVRTHSGAIVTAPSDGSVLYAGPFRSYGQLLILNAGDGYHLVLAGMSRISVRLGQNVVAGEPVGAMGETRVASVATSGDENTGPELYIEFRREGKPVDPAPWWTDRNTVRAGNDT
jgi:murein hydrolase activator